MFQESEESMIKRVHKGMNALAVERKGEQEEEKRCQRLTDKCCGRDER
jgi:hypothetical protein